MQTIDNELKTRQFSPFHLIYGDERYMVKYYKNSIRKAMGLEEDEMNASYYQGDGISISEVIDVAQTMPFFAEKRLIIVENSGFFKSANDLADFLPDVPDSTVMVFVEKEIDKRNRLYKYLQKNGVVTEAKTQSENALVGWVGKYMQNAGKNITRETVYAILSRVGLGMDHLSMELEKLISYVGEKPTVELEDVQAICTVQATNRIFDMVDYVSGGKRKEALNLYHNLVQLKEPPARILFLLARHVNIMLHIDELESRRTPRDEMAKKAGVPPFTIQKYATQARTFGRERLIAMLEECTSLEQSIKTGRMNDQMAVELFILAHTK